MVNIDFTPDYRVIWVNPLASVMSGIFAIWMDADKDKPGKFWEEYDEQMHEGRIFELNDDRDQDRISFSKQYDNTRGTDLITERVLYVGEKSKRWNLIEGVWRPESAPLDEIRRFYLARSPEEGGGLNTILGKLHFVEFDKRLFNMQKESPFLPIIPVR